MLKRPFIPLLVVLLIIATGCTVRYNAARYAETQAELMELVDELVGAIERADVEGAFKYHSSDPSAIFIVDGRPYSRAELVQIYSEAYASVDSQEIVHDEPTLRFISLDEVIMTITGRVTTTMKSGATNGSGVAWTLIWSKSEAAGWQLAHVHQSFPGRTSG